MANTTSAKKATRKIARRTIINKSRRTQMRGAVRIVEEAIKSGDRDAALKAMARAEPEGLTAHASDRQTGEMNQSKKILAKKARQCRAFSFCPRIAPPATLEIPAHPYSCRSHV